MSTPKEHHSSSFKLENTYHWPADGESRPWTEFWVTTFTRPVGAARRVNVLFSADRGESWAHREMERACVLGDQDVWHVNLGTFPAGARLRYAVEGVDPRGRSFWDNAGGKDHHAVIGSAKDQRVSG